MPRRAVARIDLDAVEHNARVLDRASGDALLCAVVKADGYGHGAVAAARAALAGGARWLATATAEEAAELRAAGLTEPRILVQGALSPDELDMALAADADVVAWTETFVAGVHARGGRRIHVKLDTGMGRLGTRDPDEADRVVAAAGDRLAGLMTHFATADEDDTRFMDAQLARFTAWGEPKRRDGLLLHAANSAATLRSPGAHLDLVRCGVALYGLDPLQRDPHAHDLRPAMRLTSYVAAVKRAAAGESAGYGRRFVAEGPTVLATVPIGYGDGVRRGLVGAEMLVRGRRRPIVGAVSMDNVTLDLGPDTDVEVGDEVVLLGGQGSERVLAEEWAEHLGTINYEVTCAIAPRVPRAAAP